MMRQNIIFKDHAVIRMLERNISRAEISEVINQGEIIEDYGDDLPYPSCLMYKMVNNIPYHVVVAFNGEQRIIVTAYIPDLSKFEPDFKTRKQG
jgi:hypothetical protein